MKMLRFLVAFLLLSTPVYAQSQIGSGTLVGNSSAARAPATQTTPTALIDRAISSTQGGILTRNATIWTVVNPSTAGLPLVSAGAGANVAYGILGLTAGGTNANLTASNGGIFYSTASAGAILSGTATARQMLQSGTSAAPAWSTTTWPATTTINRLLWSSAANVISDLATANNGVLATDGGGIPAIVTTLPCLNFPALSGDLTTVANACATTLATVNLNVGSFGSSTAIPNFTVNGKGLITAAGTNVVIAPAGTLTGTTLAANVVSSSLTSAAVGTFGSAATASTGTSGATLGFLNGNNTWSGTNAFAGTTITTTSTVPLTISSNGSFFTKLTTTQNSVNTGLEIVSKDGAAANFSSFWYAAYTGMTFQGPFGGNVSFGISTSAGGGANIPAFNVNTDSTTTFVKQFLSSSGVPTIASGACGTGTNGVITSGSNQTGLVTIGAAATTTCTIGWSAALATAPSACVIFPQNAAAAATGTTVARVSSISTTNFVITGTALANAAYYWHCY